MSLNKLITVKNILRSVKSDNFLYIFETWDCFTISEQLIENLNTSVTLGLSPHVLNKVNESLSASANNVATFHNTLIQEGASRRQIIDLTCEACKVTHLFPLRSLAVINS